MLLGFVAGGAGIPTAFVVAAAVAAIGSAGTVLFGVFRRRVAVPA